MAQSAIVCKREVPISPHRRQYGGGVRARGRVRDGRIAKLSISASPLRLKRPRPASPKTPATLDVNVVAVRELKPPPGADPVEWLLLTTEPIATEEQILSIIDAYRARWRIEEFFKALKTGCALEKRQLESKRTLLNALALFIPVAWNLLRLRTTAREKRILSAQKAMMAIADLGGHLRSNGDPGWQVLGRGYQDLLMMVVGYRLARDGK